MTECTCSVGGLAIIVAGSKSLGKNLTPLPVPRQEQGSLVKEGMFKCVTAVLLSHFLNALLQTFHNHSGCCSCKGRIICSWTVYACDSVSCVHVNWGEEPLKT
jgi:hypothetical protein